MLTRLHSIRTRVWLKFHGTENSVLSRFRVNMVAEHGVGTRRAAWRLIASVEQKENLVDNEQPATYATEHVVQVETELRGIRDGILAPMDTNLTPSASTGEPKEFNDKTETIEEQGSKLDGSYAAQAPEWDELQRLRAEELVAIRETRKKRNNIELYVRRFFIMSDSDELIPEWLNVVKGVVASENLPLNIYRETLLQNKILRVIKKNQVTKYLEMLAEIAEKKDDDYKKFYKQFGKRLKLGNHEYSTVGVKIAELLGFDTSKSGDEEISLKEYVDRMKEEQNDICHITGESIAVVSSSSSWENLRKEGYEVLYMSDPVDEFAVQQLKEGLDLGDDDEKNKIEELKAEFKPLTKLMKEVLGNNVEMVIASDRIVDSPCVPSTSEYGWSAKIERIMEAQSLRDNSMTSHMVSKKTTEVNPTHSIMMELKSRHDLHGRLQQQQQRKGSKHQPTKQSTRQEREKERGRSEREEERESVKKGHRGRRQEGRKEEEEREAEKEGSEQVEKDVTGWTEVTRKRRRKTVQIFVKINGSKATPMEVSLSDDKVEDVLRQVQIDEDVYVTMHGRMLKTGEKLKSCGVTDGCTIQVTSRMRGGGKHKDKKSKGEKKLVAQLDDGMCSMACEQIRWITESISTLQSTEEEKRRLAEEVDKVRKMMAGMEKQVTGEDLQRLSEMEEGLKKFEDEVQAKDVDEPEVTGRLVEEQTGRGSAGLVRGGDERHWADESNRKGKGKGNGGKGDHGSKGGAGCKGTQQVKNLAMDEDQEADEENERDRVAPNMGAGGSHPQATSDPGEEKEKKMTRVLSWADCNDEEVQENEEKKVEEEKEMRREKTTGEKPPGLESELKAQEEKKLSWVEDEQEAKEEERRRAQEAQEQRRAQEAREEERRTHEAREQTRAQEAREDEERRAQEAREEEMRAQEAREQTRAQKAREEEQRRALEALEQRKAQEEQEEEAKAQEEREREVKAREEQREQEREVEAQGGHESDVQAQEGHEGEVKAQEEQGEDANSMHEGSHVSNRHMTWWHNAWWVRVKNGPHLQTARDRRRVWRAATRAAQEVRDTGKVAGGEREKREQGKTERTESNTLHIVFHFNPTAAATAATVRLQ